MMPPNLGVSVRLLLQSQDVSLNKDQPIVSQPKSYPLEFIHLLCYHEISGPYLILTQNSAFQGLDSIRSTVHDHIHGRAPTFWISQKCYSFTLGVLLSDVVPCHITYWPSICWFLNLKYISSLFFHFKYSPSLLLAP